MPTLPNFDHAELVELLHGKPSTLSRPGFIDANAAHKLADEIVNAGFRKIFDGDCGLNNIRDVKDREAAEAWMRWANLVNNPEDGNGIAAMKQMLAEFGYERKGA